MAVLLRGAMPGPLLLVLILCCSSSTLAAAQSPPQQPFAVSRANVRGDTLILDVGSLRFQGNHPVTPPITEAAGCADACLRTPGCNAWTFCASKGGCGSGCAAYVQQHPPLRVAANGNPTLPSPEWTALPAVTGFGPWGLTSGCKCEWDSSSGTCKPGDKFPFGMCSLKRLSDPSKPQFWSTNAAEGFVSGTWSPPPECKGVSGRTCTRCAASKDPAGCLRCAATLAARTTMLEAATDSGVAPADGCAACYRLAQPAAAAKCVACLTSNSECAACALQPADASGRRTMDVAACIECVQSPKLQGGGRFAGACVDCAALGGQPAQMRECMACLVDMAPLACDTTAYQAPCWNPRQQPSACATCAAAGPAQAACRACLKRQPFSQDCGGCSTLTTPAAQQQCYACAQAARHPGSGCSDCLSSLTDRAQQEQCVACLATPSLAVAAKQWCFGCQNWCSDSGGRAQCVACLGTTPQDGAYMTACACK